MSYFVRKRGMGAVAGAGGNFTYSQDADGNWIATPVANAYTPVVQGGGSIVNAGGASYNPGANTLLDSSVIGNAPPGGVTQSMNTNYYATQQTAQQFAQALGGQVVIDPNSQGFSTSAPMYAIKLPDGTTVNAGNLAAILGNDAAFPGTTVKSGEIAKLLGASYDPNLAGALLTGTPISVTAGAPASGYNPTPLNKGLPVPSGSPSNTISPTQYTAWQKASAAAIQSAANASPAPIVTSSASAVPAWRGLKVSADGVVSSNIAAPASSSILDFFSGSSFGFPNWGLAAAALVAAFAFSGGTSRGSR